MKLTDCVGSEDVTWEVVLDFSLNLKAAHLSSLQQRFY